jgi:phage-related tail protein
MIKPEKTIMMKKKKTRTMNKTNLHKEKSVATNKSDEQGNNTQDKAMYCLNKTATMMTNNPTTKTEVDSRIGNDKELDDDDIEGDNEQDENRL